MKTILVVLALVCCAAPALAQPQANPYGTSVTLDAAKKIALPALAEARKNGWTMAVAVVDAAGELVYFERMDNTQLGSIDISIAKAKSAARFKRPTKVFQDQLAAGGDRRGARGGRISADHRWQDRGRHRRVRRHLRTGRTVRQGGRGPGEVTDTTPGIWDWGFGICSDRIPNPETQIPFLGSVPRLRSPAPQFRIPSPESRSPNYVFLSTFRPYRSSSRTTSSSSGVETSKMSLSSMAVMR